MKVIAVNGSPHKRGNTSAVLDVMTAELAKEGIEAEVIQIGEKLIHGCIGCGYCRTSEDHQCVFKDDMVNDVSKKMRKSDGIILAAPTYYAGIPGTMKAFLDRVFYSSSSYFKYKVGTAAAVVRRTGGLEVADQLNHFFNLAEMVSPPSQYWMVGYGRIAGEVLRDAEGIQTIRKNARAMAWLLKVIDAGGNSIPFPEEEERVMTNFIRE